MIDNIETNPIPQHILRSNESFFTHEDFIETDIIFYSEHFIITKAVLPTLKGSELIAIKRPYRPQYATNNIKNVIIKEAVITNKLCEHKNIIGVFNWGRKDIPWIAIEYFDGGTLYKEKENMSFIQSLWTSIMITKALNYSHRNGVIHNDIKTTNIGLQKTSKFWKTPKIIDWSSAIENSGWTPAISKKISIKNLPEGFINPLPNKVIKGDPITYSPEQIMNSNNIDSKSDIYQTGSMLYHLFTGVPTFDNLDSDMTRKKQEENRKKMILNVYKDPKRPSTIADVPELIDDILLKALKTRKEDRYQHIHQLERDLVRVYNEEAASHHPKVY